MSLLFFWIFRSSWCSFQHICDLGFNWHICLYCHSQSNCRQLWYKTRQNDGCSCRRHCYKYYVSQLGPNFDKFLLLLIDNNRVLFFPKQNGGCSTWWLWHVPLSWLRASWAQPWSLCKPQSPGASMPSWHKCNTTHYFCDYLWCLFVYTSPFLIIISIYHTQENLDSSRSALETDVLSKQSNINVRAAVIHVLGDLIQSVGVFIAAIVIKFNVSILWGNILKMGSIHLNCL